MKNSVFLKAFALLLVCCCVFPLLLPSGAQADSVLFRVRVIKGGVSLRTQPYEDAPKIRGVHENYELDVYREQNGWYYVYYKGDYGWVVSTRVNIISGPTSRPTARPTTRPTARPTARPTVRPNVQPYSGSDHHTNFANITAWPSMNLSVRTGPSPKYDGDDTYSKSTSVRARSKAYDANNNRWWILFSMTYRGKEYWLYTGEQRFDGLDLNLLPTEEVIGFCYVSMSAEAWFAPSENAARMNWDVPAETACDIYALVSGPNSDFILVDFYDTRLQTWRRAWIKDWYVDSETFY